MKFFQQTNTNKNITLALGFFDGVHLAHQTVIKSAVDFAKEKGTKSAVITFQKHPCHYLQKTCQNYILTKAAREDKIRELGVDYLYELDFQEISNLSAADYLEKIIVEYFRPISISTGWNHCFGHNKTGNAQFLKNNASKFGYKYFEIPPQKLDDRIINSTSIREFLSSGEIENANNMLGFEFEITSTVQTGNKIGRTIGFRTANLVYPQELVKIPYGVYSVNTNYGKAIANYGIRPTIKGVEPILEVHILNFNKDIYGKTLNVKFLKMIRPEMKFDSLDALKMQIQKDLNSIT